MGKKKLLSWLLQESLGPVGRLFGFAEAVLSDDETDKIRDFVTRNSAALDDLHAKNFDASHLGAVQDYHTRGQVAVSEIMENRERTLDWLTSVEAHAMERGDREKTRWVRTERERFLKDSREQVNRIRDMVRQKCGQDP